jgi:hypothetical protein
MNLHESTCRGYLVFHLPLAVPRRLRGVYVYILVSVNQTRLRAGINRECLDKSGIGEVSSVMNKEAILSNYLQRVEEITVESALNGSDKKRGVGLL